MSTRNSLFPFLVAATLLLIAALASAQSALPGSGWTTGFQFQNIGSSSTTVSLLAYDQSGAPYDCGAKNAPPQGSVNFLFDVDCLTPPDFSGSAVIESGQPTRGIVHINNVPGGLADGIYAGTTMEATANESFFSLVKHNRLILRLFLPP